MDKLRAMQTFVRIVDKGSLTAAATSLGTSLPAVVRTLAALEAHLQVRLLNRTTRRLALTEDGRSYLDSCRRILATIDEVEAGLTTRQVELAGHLTVTAPMLFGQMYVAPAVTRFVQRYPAVHCSLNFADRVVDLLEEGVDVGVRIGPLRDSTLIAQPVGRIRRVVVATPAFLRKHGVPRHPEDLAREPCLRFSNGNPHWWTFQDDGRVFQVQVTGNLEFNQTAPAVAACAAGAGFGHFLSYQVAPLVAEKKLRIVLEDYELAPWPLSVLYPHARMLPARTRALIDWLKADLAPRFP
ncbi:LysR family transcriptional regulator [Cupriavidus gilardii]|uniref:LysR family transcriptional regulator n=1 Tax=Cupriavidus gilardii TaxID=82541 RepID=A0A849B402_9BURK|nr:LysR family transcriptional regulator [Cupriavidus gilardii]ALD93663.1 LysR family transcriptional regulator [Cupriavidus gilardii CR3]QQE08967.1 LysR family transcriptional regulator [Cupriavidus sp. ISTL7]KAB0597033.1 LysR family transcriptional regulator [Cupriavidus gilardii]MCT9015035.1 LysR family transcriptional regulator [Cupriavidus gilardii]MCT9053447.1 LysR family transcriptional regulator [Cupriavidus gilardii]